MTWQNVLVSGSFGPTFGKHGPNAWYFLETVVFYILIHRTYLSINFSNVIYHVLPFTQFQDIGLEGAKMRPFFCAKNGMAHECARHVTGLLMVLWNGILDNYEITIYIHIYIYYTHMYIYIRIYTRIDYTLEFKPITNHTQLPSISILGCHEFLPSLLQVSLGCEFPL